MINYTSCFKYITLALGKLFDNDITFLRRIDNFNPKIRVMLHLFLQCFNFAILALMYIVSNAM